MESNKTFWESLNLMIKEGRKMYNENRNWLEKQEMFVAVQLPDENSKMNKPYLYMQVVKKNGEISIRPRMPSMLDLFSEDWFTY
jgi:hypothetical protein